MGLVDVYSTMHLVCSPIKVLQLYLCGFVTVYSDSIVTCGQSEPFITKLVVSLKLDILLSCLKVCFVSMLGWFWFPQLVMSLLARGVHMVPCVSLWPWVCGVCVGVGCEGCEGCREVRYTFILLLLPWIRPINTAVGYTY